MSDLDKTIEELEAEVMAELEEGTHDAPKQGAVPAEPMKKKQKKSLVTPNKREKGNLTK